MIPNDWHLATLGEIAKLQTGSSINDKVKKEKYLGKTEGLTYIATKDISFNNEIDYDTNIKIPESDGYKIAPANTALLCIEGGSAGRKLGFTNQPVCYVNKLCAFITVDVHSKFVYYFLQTLDFIDQFKARKHGLIGGVPLKSLSTINIPIPPLDEQERIVKYLDSLLTKLNRVRVLAQKIVDGYELRRGKILYDAFTGKLTNNDIETWQNLQLKDTISNIRYGTSEKSDYEQNGIPVLRIPNIADNNNIDFNDLKYLSEKNINDNFKLNENDILIIRSNGSRDLIGKCALVPKLKAEFAYASFLMRIIPAKNILPKFFVFYLNSIEARLQIFNMAKSTNGIHNINSKELGSVKIKLPNIEEQKEIVCHFDSLLTKEQQTKELAESVLSNIEMMKKKILGKVFRGE